MQYVETSIFSLQNVFANLQLILNENDYSCCAALSDQELPEIYKDVEI